MKTEIFPSYSAFLDREDKAINGVSPALADAKSTWAEERENEGCWNCSGCSYCSGCSGCSDCFRCSGCSDCFRCSYCSGCSDCSGCSGKTETRKIPVIPNIHQRIEEAVNHPNALEMRTWHTCNTTHCRAGWVVTIAGEAGKKLEDETSTAFAAMMIYKASSEIRVSPTRFYETNEVAMEDILRCAELEKKGGA